MTNPPPPAGTPNDKSRAAPEAALGGADAVGKTTYVIGSGTEPERQSAVPASNLKGQSGSAPNTTWAIVVFLAVSAVLVYVFGFGR